MKLRALTRHAERVGVTEEKLDNADSTDDVIALILEIVANQGSPAEAVSLSWGAEGAASQPEPEPQPGLVEQESHGKHIIPTLGPDHSFHLVFSNKTIWDPLCLEVRAKLVADGVRIWQQKTNIPKDSENWFNEWYPSAIRARKIVCFISADYLRSPYCMKEFDIAISTDSLLVVACEPIKQILAVDVGAYPYCSNAHAYLVRGGQVIFNGRDDIVAEIRKFLA